MHIRRVGIGNACYLIEGYYGRLYAQFTVQLGQESVHLRSLWPALKPLATQSYLCLLCTCNACR